MTNWPPYNPYANALNVDDIIEKLRPTPCDPVFHSYKFTFGMKSSPSKSPTNDI